MTSTSPTVKSGALCRLGARLMVILHALCVVSSQTVNMVVHTLCAITTESVRFLSVSLPAISLATWGEILNESQPLIVLSPFARTVQRHCNYYYTL